MKKLYIFIVIISILLIGISIFLYTNLNLNNEEIDNISNTNRDNPILYGDFLQMIVTESVLDVDYELIKTNINHPLAAYVTIAENYDVIEKNYVTTQMLDKPITKFDAFKLCALCDINMRHHERKDLVKSQESSLDGLSTLDSSLINHVLAINLVDEISADDLKQDVFLTTGEASDILIRYMNIE